MKKIAVREWSKILSQDPSGYFLVFGQEPQHIQDIVEHTIVWARQKSIETSRFYQSEDPNAKHLTRSLMTPDLFGSGKQVLVYTGERAPSNTFKAEVEHWPQATSSLILLVFPTLTAASLKSVWLKKLLASGGFVQTFTLNGSDFLRAISEKAKELKITLDAASIRVIAESCQGNLSSSYNMLYQIELLQQNEPLSIEHIQKLVFESSQLNPFELGMSWLCNRNRYLDHLSRAETNNEPLPKLIWSLQDAASKAVIIKTALAEGQSFSIASKKANIWANQQSQYQEGLKRHTLTQLEDALIQLSRADIFSKTGKNEAALAILTQL